MTNTKSSEHEEIGVNYLIIFFREVAALTHSYANYYTAIAQMKDKYGDKDGWDKGISEEDRKILLEVLQNLRYYGVKTMVQFRALKQQLRMDGDEVEAAFKQAYDVKKYVLILDDVERYVIALNGFLLKDVVKDMFDRAQDFINKVYT
jgi:hypothetical protein